MDGPCRWCVTHISRPSHATRRYRSPVPARFETSGRQANGVELRVPRVRRRPAGPLPPRLPRLRPHLAPPPPRAGRGRLPGRGPVPAGLRALRRYPPTAATNRARSAWTPSRSTRRSAATSRRRAHRPRLGRGDRLRRGRCTRPSAGGASSAMARAARRRAASRHFLDEPDAAQALLVHVLLPAPAGRPRRRRQRPRVRRHAVGRLVAGLRRPEELARLKPSLRDPANLGAALGYYRARLGDGRTDPTLDAVQEAAAAGAATATPVPPRRRRRLHRRARWRRRRGGMVPVATSPSRSSTGPATSSTSSGPNEVNRRVVEFLTPDDWSARRCPTAWWPS